jgi:hypothetical protein
MKQVKATSGKGTIRKPVSFDVDATIPKLEDIRKFFRDNYKLDVSESAIIRRCIDNYHWYLTSQLTNKQDQRLWTNEPDKLMKAAQPGKVGYMA